MKDNQINLNEIESQSASDYDERKDTKLPGAKTFDVTKKNSS